MDNIWPNQGELVIGSRVTRAVESPIVHGPDNHALYLLHAVPKLYVIGGLGPVRKDAGGIPSSHDTTDMGQGTVLHQRKLVLVMPTYADGYPVECWGKEKSKTNQNVIKLCI